MSKRKWNYNGDMNLEYGGFYWKEDGADDYVLCVRVTPCSDAGGPNNQFWIESGSIYMPNDPEKRRRALSVCGYENEPNPSRGMLVDAFMAYQGVERDCMNGQTVVQIGAKADEPGHGWGEVRVDQVIRGNAKLANYVRDNFLD